MLIEYYKSNSLHIDRLKTEYIFMEQTINTDNLTLSDEKGNIIMREVEEIVKEKDAEGNLIYRKEVTQEKVLNDQTVHVADIFTKWKNKQGIVW